MRNTAGPRREVRKERSTKNLRLKLTGHRGWGKKGTEELSPGKLVAGTSVGAEAAVVMQQGPVGLLGSSSSRG